MFNLREITIDCHAFFLDPGADLHQPNPLATSTGFPIHRFNGPAKVLGPGNLQLSSLTVHLTEEIIRKTDGNCIHACSSFLYSLIEY